MAPIPPGPHRRFNPLLDEWVLCSPQRLDRPWQGQVEAPETERLPPHDPACALCPGSVRANGARNPDYAGSFAFDNDFPALAPGAPAGGAAAGLLRAEPAAGRCRVLAFTPRHDLSLARMAPGAIRGVAEESAALEAEGYGYVQAFENKGALMGCSNAHPHGQLWATRHVPHLPGRKDAAQRRHFAATGRDLLGDYLEAEGAEGARLVCANDAWVALVPFWAVWPFETLLLPRRRVAHFAALPDEERAALADLLRRLLTRYDNLFRCSFPYTLGWHGRPPDAGEAPHWRLHAFCFPPLLRSATVRKFLVGYELAAEPQRDLTPEDAAERLRACSEDHYLGAPAP
jgi:UDPglucose--hexose-1-phosphate uridylyltransferase